MAGIPLSSNFNLNAQLPLDERMVAADLTARDAIVTTDRYEGLICYVESEQITYQLRGGLANINWETFGGGDVDGGLWS